MINYSQFRETIEVLIDTEFDTAPVQFENTFIKPKDSYVSLQDQNTYSSSMGMGESVYEVHGILTIMIFSVLGTGTEMAKSIASELSEILKNHTIDGLSLETPVLTSFGQVDGALFYQHNLTIPYQYFYGQGNS